MGASVTATTGAKRYKLSKLEKSERLLGIALLTPAALLLLAVVVYPIVELLINSLYSYRLTRPGYRFIGLENYAYALFEENGVLDATTGQRFWREVLAVGGSRPALESFKAFRGREPSIDALLRHNGMVAA